MHRDNNICIFYIPKLLKTPRPTFHQQPLELHAYAGDPSLCAVTYIEQYITVTQSIRNKENNSLLAMYSRIIQLHLPLLHDGSPMY